MLLWGELFAENTCCQDNIFCKSIPYKKDAGVHVAKSKTLSLSHREFASPMFHLLMILVCFSEFKTGLFEWVAVAQGVE